MTCKKTGVETFVYSINHENKSPLRLKCLVQGANKLTVRLIEVDYYNVPDH